MKIFDKDNNSWLHKVNFVDINNVFVGYDMSSQCCENFGWFISSIEHKDIVPDESSNFCLDKYIFDTKFFVHYEKEPEGWDDCENIVIFRLTHGNSVIFLHLYNHHNGYYHHGFGFHNCERTICEGEL